VYNPASSAFQTSNASVAETINGVSTYSYTVEAGNAKQALANLNADTQLSAALAAAAQNSTLSLADLRTIVAIESTANPNTGTNAAGATGVFQVTAGALQDVRNNFPQIQYSFAQIEGPGNFEANVAVGVAYLNLVAKRLSSAGIPTTAVNVYLAYQEGVAGFNNILNAVNNGSASTILANANLLNNLPSNYLAQIADAGRQVTVLDFYNYWRQAYSTEYGIVNSGL
jgi:hypothetical protein